jgi:LPS export ABC transporter protein LptC
MGSSVILPRIATRIALGAGLLSLACGPAQDLAGFSASLGPPPPARLRGVVFEGYSAGAREVEVRAARAEVDYVGRVVRLQRVRIDFQDPQHGRIQVRAKRAEFLMDSDDFVLREQVEGSTDQGERFKTAQVHYEQAAQRLWTDQPVRLHREGLVVEGEGMEIDLSTRRIRLIGKVEARMKRE